MVSSGQVIDEKYDVVQILHNTQTQIKIFENTDIIFKNGIIDRIIVRTDLYIYRENYLNPLHAV